ncbi:MAG: hypothetical protein ACD_37C00019G0002 [uncultured bacterium]|nr:MAG: hypothetical protein ACD_37C00019G0002 [uncultured bacterium]
MPICLFWQRRKKRQKKVYKQKQGQKDQKLKMVTALYLNIKLKEVYI